MRLATAAAYICIGLAHGGGLCASHGASRGAPPGDAHAMRPEPCRVYVLWFRACARTASPRATVSGVGIRSALMSRGRERTLDSRKIHNSVLDVLLYALF
eukprot:4306891-Prymnesium_polylepis.1